MLMRLHKSTNPVKFDTMVTFGLFHNFAWGDKETIYVSPNDIWTYMKIEKAKTFCYNCFTPLKKKEVHTFKNIPFCLPCKMTIKKQAKAYKNKQLAMKE